MDETQLLKGILEGCVLNIIQQEETYGYDIIVRLTHAGFTNIIEGTLYPILTRLEKKEYICCRKAKSPFGPIRKYYSITPLGETQLDAYKAIYKETIEKANHVLFDEVS